MDMDPSAGGRGVDGVADSSAPPAPASAATSSASASAAAPARRSTGINVYDRRYPRRKLKPSPYPDSSPPPEALTLAQVPPPLPDSTALAPAEPAAVPTATPGGVSPPSQAVSAASPSSRRASPKVATRADKVAPASQDIPEAVRSPLRTPSPPALAPAAHSEDAPAPGGDGRGGVHGPMDMARNREERRELRRRLGAELQQVQALHKRLDAAADALARRDRSTLAPGRPPPLLLSAKPGETGHRTGAAITPGRPLARRQPLTPSVVPIVPLEKEKRTPKANPKYSNSEFLLAKDRLPPANSHGQKKSKHHKELHSLPAGAAGFAAKQRLCYDPLKKCESLLGQLMNHKFGWIFNSPVDPVKEGLPDYFHIIKHPMDLGTIKERLNRGHYRNPREFAEDVRLTFDNALMYNSKGHDVNSMAERLLGIFEVEWSEINAADDYLVPSPAFRKKFPPPPNDLRGLEQSNSAMHHMLLDSKTKLMHNTPSYLARTPALKKPKAKDPDKRDMTPKEKEKLCKDLENLPSEKLKALLPMLQSKNVPVEHKDDQIEVDIYMADADTLWELDRFVTNYKKNLSKIKRKAQVARQEVEMHAQETTLQRSQEPDGGEPPKQNEMVEEQLATNLPALDGNNGGNTSTSSGSDSSESGSSSSGSDW